MSRFRNALYKTERRFLVVLPMFQKNSGLDELLNRPRPTAWQEFVTRPCAFLAVKLYSWRKIIPSQPVSPVAVVCISDTHNSQPAIPKGEILIHAGDLTQSGSFDEMQTSLDWLNSLPHHYKIVVAGNHDAMLDEKHRPEDSAAREALRWGNITYLKESSVTIQTANGRELNVYGSPMSPRHGNWAFQYPRSLNVWSGKIPTDTDILITHAPPKSHLDLGHGCIHLLDELWHSRPRLHVYGHVHEGYGVNWVRFDGLQRAYEKTMIAGGGLSNLTRVVYEFAVAYFTPLRECQTVLVNASMIGGIRDEKRREPILVQV